MTLLTSEKFTKGMILLLFAPLLISCNPDEEEEEDDEPISTLIQFGNGVTDIEGNQYQTVIIGNQEWMAENLRTKTYNNGDPITQNTDPDLWPFQDQGLWTWYDNDPVNETPYGVLYNWNAAMDSRSLCPSGWHVPSDDEWGQLTLFLDPTADTTCESCVHSSTAGGKLKSTGIQHWQTPNSLASNESGFSGMPGGYLSSTFYFSDLTELGLWWSSTEPALNSNYAINRTLYFDSANIGEYYSSKGFGLCVRCIKD
ncbi:MAG: fibrobacter succinogenes major paralogous domain-containing protein [Pseudomonadota bacterium]